MAQSISDAFRQALMAGVQTPIVKVEILDAITRAPIRTITTVDDGSVTVDVTRGTRRTVQLRLSNKDGQFTPTDSSSAFAFNNLIAVYRGLKTSAGDEYIRLGTFFTDRPEVFAERNMAVLTVDGSDFWKKIATGGFPSGFSYPIGTHINTIIAKVAETAGITSRWIRLDPLSSRTSASRLTGTTMEWEPGASRNDFLTNLATQFGIHIYFDPYGVLTSREVPDPVTSSPVWTFMAGADAIMLGVTKIQNDLKLINHVIVSGEGSNGIPTGARADIRDNDPNSPTYWQRIGDRVMTYAAPLVTTNEQAMAVARKLYAENCLIEENIKVPTICLPQLEGNDVFEVVEPTWAKISSRYLAQRFDIPLRDSRMTIEAKTGRPLP